MGVGFHYRSTQPTIPYVLRITYYALYRYVALMGLCCFTSSLVH